MTKSADEFFESLQAIAHGQAAIPFDPETEQARDEAIAAARPRTHAYMRSLLEIHDAHEAELCSRSCLLQGWPTR